MKSAHGGSGKNGPLKTSKANGGMASNPPKKAGNVKGSNPKSFA